MKRTPVVLLVLLVFFGYAFAQEFRNIGAEELKKMMDGKKAVVVDARPADEFRKGHIPGAVNVPPEKVSSIEKLLPKDRKKPIVIYCRGVG